jgi:branched-chain amino acid transport system permease protein
MTSMDTSKAAGLDVLPGPSAPTQVAGLTHWSWTELLGPVGLVVVVAYLGAMVSPGMSFMIEGALALLVMVLALQVFIGNSGVLSFGHGAFALLGGFTTGLVTMPSRIKENVHTDLLPFLQSLHSTMVPGVLLGIFVALVVGLVVGVFLMRLHGLAAGIATFAVLMVADNIFFNSRAVGPGPQVMPQIPRFPFLEVSLLLAVVAIVVAYALGVARSGRLLRASREDFLAAQALGASIWRLRVLYFTISAGMAGLSGAMYAHHAAAVSARDFYLGFTFLTLGMLIIGGSGSVWGAVVGCAVVTALSQVLLDLEQGLQIGNLVFDIPDGARSIAIAAALVLVLLWRPTGITKGAEFRLPWRPRTRDDQPLAPDAHQRKEAP